MTQAPFLQWFVTPTPSAGRSRRPHHCTLRAAAVTPWLVSLLTDRLALPDFRASVPARLLLASALRVLGWARQRNLERETGQPIRKNFEPDAPRELLRNLCLATRAHRNVCPTRSLCPAARLQ